MVKKFKQLLSVTMALAMIFSSLGISEQTISAETTETNVVYSGNFAYDKTTGHLYEFVKETKSWNDAKSAAETKGGYLVCISSAEENALVSNLANDNSDARTVWIGLQRNAEQLSEWQWLDGTTVAYTNWYTGEPNSTAETVAELYNKSDKTVGTWNDNKATALNHFVVEYSACSHPDSKYVYENRTLTDCAVGGYTGEKYCGICNTKLSDGTTLEPQAHEEGVFDESSVIEVTCEEDGFSGNYICPTCNKVLTAGTVVPHTGHTAAAGTRNSRATSCYLAGYTGDTYCSVCDETISAGTSIEKYTHDYENDICNKCGRINNAQLGTKYTLEITEEQLIKVIQFQVPNTGNYTINCKNTTSWDSYGYLYSSDRYNDEIFSSELEKFYSGEDLYIRPENYMVRNDDDGENYAPKISAELNKDTTYYFVALPHRASTGQIEVTISCNHDSTHIEGRTIANCTTGGYTGDEVCDICNATVNHGTTVAAGSEHGTAVLDEDSVIEATCENDGFSGNYICPYCETILTAGTVVTHTGHTAAADLKNAAEANCYCNGYTGDTYCSTCDEIITTGTTIERTNHQYEDHICKNCGRVEDAQEGVTYSLKTTKSFLYQIIEFKPEHDGMFEFYCKNTTDWDSYGYLYQGDDFSEEMLVAAMESESYREGIKGYIYSNDDDGSNSAPAIGFPLKKGETYYFVVGPYSNKYGEFDITINCAHAKTHIENKTIENCVSGGYTGDVFCDECHKVISTGTQLEPNSTHDFIATKHIDATCSSYEYIEYKCLNCGETGTEVDEEGGYGDHSYELVGYIAPTCTTDGCSGHYECIYCEEKQTGGDVVLKSYHYTEEDTDNDFFIYNYNAVEATCENAGYTGDTKCTICNEIVEEGQVIPAKAHNFATGVCTKCGIPQSITEVEVDGYYQISTFDDLIEYLYIQKQAPDAGVKGKLMNDIAFPENYKDDDNLMKMTYLVNSIFDGNGHTISGINVKGEPCPLFTVVYCSEIKNLNIECSGVTNTEYNMNAYLAYAGIQSTFTKCSLSGSKTIEYNGTDEMISAMLIEAETCEFIECTNDADIDVEANNGNVFVAGLVGAASGTSFSKCVNNGSITVTTGGQAEVVGVTLYIYDSYAKQCTNNGDITVDAEDEASVAGVVSSMIDSSLEECTNNGILSANSLYEYSEVSGILMYARHDNRDVINISKCKNTGKLEGMYVSGICGQAENTIIDDCTNTADIEASNSASGILSYGDGNIKLRNCQNDGNISGCNGASGICETLEFYGKSINEIEGCVNNGNITSIRYAAGIIGYASNMDITDCYNNGNIKANLYAGGILSEGYYNKVSNCVNNGNISGFINIGGIAGYDEGSIFDKIYNTGKIDSENEAYIKNPLVNGNYNTEINESEENHIHNFNFSGDVVKATIDKDGYAEGKCVCGQNYKGVISKIASVDISNVKYEYTGKNIVLPSVTVKDSKGNVIDNKYYTVVYRNKVTGALVTQVKDSGTYEVVITFNTIYSGEVTRTFTVEKKNDTINSNGNKENNTGTTPSVTKVTKPGRVKGVSAKKLKRRIRIKWRKLKQVKGYQVRYATNKKMKKAKIKTVAKNKFVIKKAKNKKYYIQVRAYRVDAAGKKIVGKWSKKKVVKIK